MNRPDSGGRPARPRTSTLLDDHQRATYLAEWDTVQTGFATSPRRAAEAAERLVDALAESIVRRIGEITDAVGGDSADVPIPDEETPDEETWRQQLLRCREAFHLLIDS